MTTALYRRYRPETFADVIGQEHVTDPLMAAIGAQRASHAYLFSGPRGCGKTTSARIFARCLNCADGPAPVPCGTCDSCVELARGGSGSLDVVEIDAASHNGVDDARELRERAAFAPARDRYKIFILDEAHMVTPQGFNALLKLVEEPPPHVKFIFATTEPDKVISTIRSRTHHYPFRLVPPDRLQAYLERICTAEGVSVGSGVLPLVVRAGGGSVRDSLSVLDQLLAGADGELDYAQAVALLGYTPETLLDDVVEALEAADGSSVFRVVDRVIESGHDPRRFVEDLLQRLRDLIVIVAAGERAADVLRGVPEDQFARMTTQAHRLGLAQLSRAGDLTMAALTEMTGATSPRLQLELLCARLLLPAADEPIRGYGARIERLEKQVESGVGSARAAAATPSAAPGQDAAAGGRRERLPKRASAPASQRPAGERPPAGAQPAPAKAESAPPLAESAPAEAASAQARRDDAPGAVAPGAGAAGGDGPSGDGPSGDGPSGDGPSGEGPRGEGPPDAAATAAPDAGLDTETVRRRWPEVLETLSRIRRASWTIASQNAQVVAVSGTALRLRFDTPGIASAFRNGRHAQAVEEALRETLGLQVQIEAVTDDSPPDGGRGTAGARRGQPDGAQPAERPDHAARAAADWATERASGEPARPATRQPGARQPGSSRGREHPDADQEGSQRGANQAPADPASAGRSAPGRPAGGRASAGPAAASPDGPSGEEPPPAEPPAEYDSAPEYGPGPEFVDDAYPAGQPGAGDGTTVPEHVPTAAAGWPDSNAEASRTTPAHQATGDHAAGGDHAAPGSASDKVDRPRRDWLAEATASSSARLARQAEPGPASPEPDEWSAADLDEQDPSDPDLEASALMGAPLVERVLGATLIDEIAVDPVGSPTRSGT